MRRSAIVLFGLLLGACATPNTIEQLNDRCPPPEFGRPGWVRFCAGTGAWIGGIVGGVASIALLPVTYPISLLADDGLGEHASSEFLLFPAVGGAAIGHCLLGAPTDSIDYLFRRAWFHSEEPVYDFEFVPLSGPAVPPAEPMVPVRSDGGD
jgi:hypothetical protein